MISSSKQTVTQAQRDYDECVEWLRRQAIRNRRQEQAAYCLLASSIIIGLLALASHLAT